MENLLDSALGYIAQCSVSHEQSLARFSLISSESAKGSLIVSSTQVYSKDSSSDYSSLTDIEVPHSVTQLMSTVSQE